MPRVEWHRFVVAAVVAGLLVAPSAVAFGQEDDSTGPTTALAFGGSFNATVSGSDTNACVYEDGNLRVQLAGIDSASILSFELANASPGSFTVGGVGGPKIALVTLSDDPNEFLVNWYGKGGTFTVDSLDTQVPVGDGSVSTKGASGSIDADIAADKHGTVHVSGPWACHMPF